MRSMVTEVKPEVSCSWISSTSAMSHGLLREIIRTHHATKEESEDFGHDLRGSLTLLKRVSVVDE
jgi:exoribonuclease R